MSDHDHLRGQDFGHQSAGHLQDHLRRANDTGEIDFYLEVTWKNTNWSGNHDMTLFVTMPSGFAYQNFYTTINPSDRYGNHLRPSLPARQHARGWYHDPDQPDLRRMDGRSLG
jgi:hypothetical protein